MGEPDISESKHYNLIVINMIVALLSILLQWYVLRLHFAEVLGSVLSAYFWGWLIFLGIKLVMPEVKGYDKHRRRGLYFNTVSCVIAIAFSGSLLQR